jgi:hypothetical protein
MKQDSKKIALPHKFQFRHCQHSNYTHTAKMNANGDYEVNWARGWANVIGIVPNVVFDSDLAAELVKAGSWVVVDDKPKQENSASSLPDEFYFLNSLGERFKAVRGQSYWTLTRQEDGRTLSVTDDQVKHSLKTSWEMITKLVLTAEQQRQVKEYKEQVAQLDSSIKLNEQDIEHRNRLIANYKERQETLRKKIEEIENA